MKKSGGVTDEPGTAKFQRIMEEAARICERQQEIYLSPQYAIGQPLSSFAERFACGQCAKAIRDAAGILDPHGDKTPAQATHPKTTELPLIGINGSDLLDAVRRLLTEAEAEKSEMGAVNWGDLGVADIEYRLSMMWPGVPFCYVIVEEASPGCKLQEWLNARLDKTKFPNTYISCEW